MAESANFEITPFPVRDKLPWEPTGRLFERARRDFSSDILRDYEPRYGWEGMRYSLGFRDGEIKEWADKKLKILEIGPGLGTSTKQLIDKGVDLYVIEPSLKYNSEDDIFLNRMKNTFAAERIRDKVSSVNATDAALAFPGQEFDTAIAIGYNFQHFLNSELAMLDQIGGVLLSLKPNKDSYFTFELGDNGKIFFSRKPEGGDIATFNLIEFLNNYSIRYTLHPFITDDGREAKAIRIFRQSFDGEDAVPKLNALTPGDTAKYLETS